MISAKIKGDTYDVKMKFCFCLCGEINKWELKNESKAKGTNVGTFPKRKDELPGLFCTTFGIWFARIAQCIGRPSDMHLGLLKGRQEKVQSCKSKEERAGWTREDYSSGFFSVEIRTANITEIQTKNNGWWAFEVKLNGSERLLLKLGAGGRATTYYTAKAKFWSTTTTLHKYKVFAKRKGKHTGTTEWRNG